MATTELEKDIETLKSLQALYIEASAIDESEFTPDRKREHTLKKFTLYSNMTEKEGKLYQENDGSIFRDRKKLDLAIQGMRNKLEGLDDVVAYLGLFDAVLNLILILPQYAMLTRLRGLGSAEITEWASFPQQEAQKDVVVSNDYLQQLLDERDFLRKALMSALVNNRTSLN